jgi:hypothetical protein
VGKIKVVEYLLNGISVFGKWFADLDAQAAAKVATALYRLEQGIFLTWNQQGKEFRNIRLILVQGTGFTLVGKEIRWSFCLQEVRRKPSAETSGTLSHYGRNIRQKEKRRSKEGDYADYKTVSQNNFTACRE